MKFKTENRRISNEDKPGLHLICSAHLDPVWQWRWEEGCSEALSTFSTAASLCEEYDPFIFCHNESLLYEWIKHLDPSLFSRIQKLVEDGRWSISGGWYLQPDVNLPSAESLIRHITTGRRFFQDHFGIKPQVAYNFDSFGHSGGLPQILRRSGYRMYIHMRPQAADLKLPADLYLWRGLDGTEIPAYRIAVGLYHTEYDNILERLDEGVRMAIRIGRDVPLFWGIGDHGGGATRNDLERIETFMAKESRVRVFHSTPESFFKAVEPSLDKAPVFEGDLQRVFTGCYTSLARIKRQAVESQHRLVQAETCRAMTWWGYNQKYPGQELEKAWSDHLFNDFHDILAGTCIQAAERDALNRYGSVHETTKNLRLAAAVCFNTGPIRKIAIPVTVFNSTAGLDLVPVEVECMMSHRPEKDGPWHMELSDLEGRSILCQEEQPEALLPFNGWRRKVVFMSPAESVKVSRYRLHPKKGQTRKRKAETKLRFSLGSGNGLIESLAIEDKPQILSGPLLRPLVIEDTADSWGTDVWSYRKVEGEMKFLPGSDCILSEGPVRIIHQSRFGYGSSRLTLKTIAYTRWPVLEYRLELLWNEKQKRLKLSIPTVLDSGRVLCEVPGGLICRPADGDEHSHGRWLMIEGTAQGIPVALGVVNTGQHGFDCREGEIRLSVLRSAAYCHERGFPLKAYPGRKLMDTGYFELRLLLVLGEPEEVIRKMAALADWLNTPPAVFAHLPIGSEESVTSFFSIEPENIRVLACKKSWREEALILRLQESAGLSTQALLSFALPQINIRLNLKPMEIKTLRIEKSGRWSEVGWIDEN